MNTQNPPAAPAPRPNPAWSIVKIILYGIAIVFFLFVGFCVKMIHGMRAHELPAKASSVVVALEPGDEVLHAYTGVQWLDSQRFYQLQADPATFERRIASLSALKPAAAGAPARRKVEVRRGTGVELDYRNSETPPWWDVPASDKVVAVAFTRIGSYGGLTYYFDMEGGIIHIRDW